MSGGDTALLQVAIIGGGPGGLGAAIEMAKLSFVEWNLYEQKAQISETGGGLSIQPQTWRLLERNGVARDLVESDFHRIPSDSGEQMRNGRTGELILETGNPKDTPFHRRTCRLVRAKLQTALLRNVDKDRIHVGKRLVEIVHLQSGRIRIKFRDGFEDEVDLLVGADGIRSVVRKFSFPKHDIRYEGLSTYRSIISKAQAMEVRGIPPTPTFWKHMSGLYVFTCPLGNDDFEVTARVRRPKEGQERVSWGKPVDLHTVLHEYDDFCLPVRQILRLATLQKTQEFDLFSGQRLDRLIAYGNIALIGDASHPLSGNFGSGVGFALEDVYTLCKALDWAWSKGKMLSTALMLFDSVRSPHYKRLYTVLDRFAAIKAELKEKDLSIDAAIEERVKRVAKVSESWMYLNDIEKSVADAIQQYN